MYWSLSGERLTLPSIHAAFWHQSTEWQCHVTANIQTLCSHTNTLTHTSTHNFLQTSWKDIWTECGTHTHTRSNRTISSVSDSTEWHFTITLWSEGREEVDLTKCLGMKGGLSHSLTKKVKVEQPEQASLWTNVSHVRSLILGCQMNIKKRPIQNEADCLNKRQVLVHNSGRHIIKHVFRC